jgi:hypothetical protein
MDISRDPRRINVLGPDDVKKFLRTVLEEVNLQISVYLTSASVS